MLADALINNHKAVSLPILPIISLSSNLNVNVVKPQGHCECYYCHPCFTDRELKNRQVK